MEYLIYVIENKANGRSYVGMTKNVKLRWLGHRSTYSKSEISKDIRQFGLTSFDFRIIDKANSEGEARAKERLYIHLLEANIPEFGYNNPTLFSFLEAEKEADIAILSRKYPWLSYKDIEARLTASLS